MDQLNLINLYNIRFSRQLLLNTSFSQYVDYEDFPGSQYQTDEQLSEFIREWVWGHHACCTAKMGNIETDPYAVLNSKAQVKGIKNLRICDVSMFPREPGHYPVVPIMIACEKIADDITKDAKR
jgi:choline dehydrogenase